MRAGIVTAVMMAAWATASSAQSFDNNSVVALHRAGLGEAAIVAKIDALPCGYDVSTEAMIALKRAGIPDGAIAAMVRRCTGAHRMQGASVSIADPRAPHSPGIYIAQDGETMPMLRPSKGSSVKITGNGSVIWPYVGRLMLPGSKSSQVVTDHRPTFYFYFSANERGGGGFGEANGAAQSPDEFSLIRFRLKGDERTVAIGRITAFSARSGIDSKETIAFESTELDGSSFKVEPKAELTPGEYAFVLTGANNSARVYDFTIR